MKRRPKAIRVAYDAGDAMFIAEVVERGTDDRSPVGVHEGIEITLMERGLVGVAGKWGSTKEISIELDAYEATVLISKLFEVLVNLQARRP